MRFQRLNSNFQYFSIQENHIQLCVEDSSIILDTESLQVSCSYLWITIFAVCCCIASCAIDSKVRISIKKLIQNWFLSKWFNFHLIVESIHIFIEICCSAFRWLIKTKYWLCHLNGYTTSCCMIQYISWCQIWSIMAWLLTPKPKVWNSNVKHSNHQKPQ